MFTYKNAVEIDFLHFGKNRVTNLKHWADLEKFAIAVATDRQATISREKKEKVKDSSWLVAILSYFLILRSLSWISFFSSPYPSPELPLKFPRSKCNHFFFLRKTEHY